MCGITGLVARADDDDTGARLAAMMRAQAHRGPDGEGQIVERVDGAQVGLGHGRLAIIDLTDAGAQPMYSRSGRDVLIFNGEIYNYREIARELAEAGVTLRTQSDTEVLLEALLLWGEAALSRLNGMWAFALLRLDQRKLLLSRDRFGVKPLYFHSDRRRFYFASEIKSVIAGAGTRFAIDANVAGRYLQQLLMDAQPETFFQGIRAVPAGHNLWIDLTAPASSAAKLDRYWAIDDEPELEGSVETIVEETRALFRDAVSLRLRSDVPVGVLLSGGVDSSAIATTMKRLIGGEQLHLISAVSDDPRFDESPFIDSMTSFLGCAAHKVRLSFTADEMFQLLGTVTRSNDEPVGSFSYVAHYLLMRQARALGVTVLLSGQGADEVLCGYRKYLGFYLQSLMKRGRFATAAKVLAQFARNGTVLNQFRFDEAKRYLPRLARSGEIDIRGPRLLAEQRSLDVGLGGGTVEERQRADVYTFSVPGLVHYEDRMSMAFGREIRLPFLDYRFVSRVLRLSTDLKLRDGWTKWVFRKALEPDLPPAICWRKDKQGFVNPQTLWLKRELRDRIETMLREPLMTAELGLVDQMALLRRYRAYCAQPEHGGRIAYKDVFAPIALEIWAREFREVLTGA